MASTRCRDAAGAGVCGFIVPDLPLEESARARAALDAEGLALVQMVTPVTPPERLARLCAASQGFVYAVTMTGTTGKSVAGAGTSASPTWIACARSRARAGVRRLRHPRPRAGARACAATSTASWSARPWWRCWSAATRRSLAQRASEA